MSGPATAADTALGGADLHVNGAGEVELSDSREAQVGAFRVRRGEIIDAQRDWQADDGRFGTVDSPLERIPLGPPPWTRP